jgi:hypothetical protein
VILLAKKMSMEYCTIGYNGVPRLVPKYEIGKASALVARFEAGL